MRCGRVHIEVPLSLADVIEGVGEEVKRLTGEAGLLIKKAVTDAEAESPAGLKGKRVLLLIDTAFSEERVRVQMMVHHPF